MWAIEIKRGRWRDWFRLEELFDSFEAALAWKDSISPLFLDCSLRVVPTHPLTLVVDPHPELDPGRALREPSAPHVDGTHPPAEQMQHPHFGQRPVAV